MCLFLYKIDRLYTAFLHAKATTAFSAS